MKRISVAIMSAIVALAAGFYFYSRDSPQLAERPLVFRVGVVPDQRPGALRPRYARLLDHLATYTGYQFELIIPEDYSHLRQMFHDHEIELAYFGGLTFVQADYSHGARPLVMRRVDTEFTSWFIVPAGDNVADFNDLRGKSLSFGSPLSTSGHLMPRHFMMMEKNIDAESFFSDVRYAGAHDETAYLVRDGKVDVGAANSVIIAAMLADGRLSQDDIRVLWETPPFPNYVWAVQSSLGDEHGVAIRNAFLALDETDSLHAKVLSDLGARYFVPAGWADFEPLYKVAGAFNLLDWDK